MPKERRSKQTRLEATLQSVGAVLFPCGGILLYPGEAAARQAHDEIAELRSEVARLNKKVEMLEQRFNTYDSTSHPR